MYRKGYERVNSLADQIIAGTYQPPTQVEEPEISLIRRPKAQQEERKPSMNPTEQMLLDYMVYMQAAQKEYEEAMSGQGGTSRTTRSGERGSVANGLAPASLVRNESNWNLQAKNDAVGAGGHVGHYGRVQFGVARLQDAMRAGAIPMGTTPEQFMASQDLQERAELWHFGDIHKNIESNNLNRYEGSTIRGITVTRDGMVAAAHLGGFGGLKRFLETGGQYDPADRNGTRLSDYLKNHAGNTTLRG